MAPSAILACPAPHPPAPGKRSRSAAGPGSGTPGSVDPASFQQRKSDASQRRTARLQLSPGKDQNHQHRCWRDPYSRPGRVHHHHGFKQRKHCGAGGTGLCQHRDGCQRPRGHAHRGRLDVRRAVLRPGVRQVPAGPTGCEDPLLGGGEQRGHRELQRTACRLRRFRCAHDRQRAGSRPRRSRRPGARRPGC